MRGKLIADIMSKMNSEEYFSEFKIRKRNFSLVSKAKGNVSM